MKSTIKNIVERIYFIYAILLFVSTMLLVLLPVWLTTLFKEPLASKLLRIVFRIWMGIFLPLVGCPVIRRGKENFEQGKNYVVVLNHNSLVDIPVSSPWIPGPNKTLAKVEMAKIPLFGIIYKAGSILVDRKSRKSRLKSYGKMQQMLEQHLHLCLYPEGTRNKTDEPLQPFFDGAFSVAIKTQKDIIPGLIFNTKKIYGPEDKLTARPCPIHIHFLEPISTRGLTADDTQALKEKVFNLMKNYYLAHKDNV